MMLNEALKIYKTEGSRGLKHWFKALPPEEKDDLMKDLRAIVNIVTDWYEQLPDEMKACIAQLG